jgi:hypothetical protein
MSKIKIIRARSTDEYVNLIEQALDDTWDLRQSIEYDEESMSGALAFIDELESGLKAIHQSMKDGSYEFATGDFPFMAILNKYHESLMPFKYLLLRINETHMRGLELAE